MYETEYPHLFSPLKLGNRELRNRIIVAPTGVIQSTNIDERICYYEEKARGGGAVVTVGMGYVDTEHGCDLPSSGFSLDTDACIPGIVAIADAIKRHGAIASMELSHAGMNSFGSYGHGYPIYAPVAMDIEGGHSGAGIGKIHVDEMPAEIIEETIQKHVDAALRAKQAGYEMVLLHGGHGWFIHQFLSPKLNTRTDEWGGSLENRMRLPITICDRIKEACGKDFLIDFRMSVRELGDGYDMDTGIEIAKAIDGHVDLIHASCGNHEGGEAFVIMHPSMFLPDGCNSIYAEEVKKYVKTPVVTVGAFCNPALMEKTLADGKADAIAVARGIIADPQLPNKARAGKADDINQCLRCFDCYSTLIKTSHYYCAINPQIGHERDYKYAAPVAKPKKVLVAGGGIAGMEAALTASKRGHHVILCEKSSVLGGVLRCEDKVPFKNKQTRFLKQQARRVTEDPNIEVRLGTLATKQLAEEINPDAIIAAVGSYARKPTAIKGAMESSKVIGAEELYEDISKAGQNVVIIGGGLTACELAIYATMQGSTVTVLVRKSQPRIFEDNQIHGEAIMAQFQHLDITMLTNTPTVEIKDDTVVISTASGLEEIKADTIVCAVGRDICHGSLDDLRYCTPEFHIVGDAVHPGNIRQAMTQAYYAALGIGVE